MLAKDGFDLERDYQLNFTIEAVSEQSYFTEYGAYCG